MIESLMFCGIGLLAGCLLTMTLFPLVHRRAVRITKRRMAESTPMAIQEIQADKDHLRAEFAMSVRRLEIGIEEMRAQATARYGGVNKQNAAIGRLQVELDRKTALILTLRAREEVRKSLVRRMVKVLLYIFVRSRRQQPPPPLSPLPLQPAPALQADQQPNQSELAATAAAIAAVNIRRRQAISNRH